MRHLRFLALTLTLALLLTPLSLAEELGEMDLYAPEVYGGEVVEEAPAAEAEEAEQAPAESEAPEFVLKAGEPTIALTEKKVSVQMNVGDALQIVVNAGETGTFKSKNKKYAAVDATGLVTALAKGSAKIEFKPSGGKTRTLSIKIVDPYEPTGVSVAQGKTVALNVGDVLQLDAVLSPDTARTTLTWKSDKSKVGLRGRRRHRDGEGRGQDEAHRDHRQQEEGDPRGDGHRSL